MADIVQASIALAIAVIVILSVTVPIIKDSIATTLNLTTTEGNILNFVSLFVILGLLVFAGRSMGLF